jgi:hypothetical protein
LRRLVLEYPILPPTENHIRGIQWSFAGGKKRASIGYTKDATNYMREFQNWIGANEDAFLDLQWFAGGHKEGMVYRLEMLLFFPAEQLLNKGWLKKWASDSRPGTVTPHKAGERKAKSPYKRVDSLNRRKLLEDCLAVALGIDDSLNFSGEVTKHIAREEAKVVLILEEAEPALFGIPEEFWNAD